MRLSLIFERVINGSVDLTSYPDLKKLIDQYKIVRIGGEYIIRPDDFDSLLDSNEPETRDFFDLTNRGEFDADLTNSIPQYRVYNFYKNLREKIVTSNDPSGLYQKAFDELKDLISDVAQNKTTLKPKVGYNKLTESSGYVGSFG